MFIAMGQVYECHVQLNLAVVPTVPLRTLAFVRVNAVHAAASVQTQSGNTITIRYYVNFYIFIFSITIIHFRSYI